MEVLHNDWNIISVDSSEHPLEADESVQQADDENDSDITLPTINCLLATDVKYTSQKFITNHI